MRTSRMAWLLTVMVFTLLAACSPAEDAAETDTGDVEEPTDVEADEDVVQSLTVATPGDVYITRDRVMLAIWPDNPNVCETLISMDQNFQMQPALATDWEFVGDNTFRFTLREDVVFHDGTPFTAEAVEYSLQRAVEVDHTLSTSIEEDSVTIIDDHTVDITPAQVNLRLPEQMVHNFMSIVAPGSDPAEEPVCTGPFKFEEYEPNDRLVVSRFDDYWGEPAQLDELIFRFLPDASARRLALEAGDVDLIYDLPLQQVGDFENRAGFQVILPEAGANYVIGQNVRGEDPYTILADEEVRRALAMSIDRDAVAQDLFQGLAEPANTVSPPGVLGRSADDVRAIPHDPEGAAELLDAAGWTLGADGIRERDGRRLSLVALAQFDTNPELLQFLQAQVREVGIELDLQRAPDAAAYAEQINAGEFDLDINYWNQNDADPARIVNIFWYSGRDNQRVRLTGPGGEFDARVEDALAAPDSGDAARFGAEAMTILIEETATAIPLTSFPFAYALRDDVAGFDPHPSVNDMVWVGVHRTS